ncbi:NINE protein [Campylobacter sp. RM9344]|uniref:NINE protein n=1 Tax=Campylobacter californiensis TaxID=1032243 RepID=A0AAW3ZX59_9BACT|nr:MULTISPECIES: NINE protein [unclassified Campylobacter]MBE2985365.1 NINE protein [Campylobacter sp. RM6883]MBE2987190.1 NINE protein [Campylobacter sp. RM12919]MBE2988899.1 NINE protein [Campylobacter sp. RM12920]MBE2995177.1 NINE protein [Campylobacter sp. RM6913]MBE3029098.1 NINE protein [Campylobacter sp. RM9344]
MNNIYVAYALWFFLGWLGAHRLYLGKFITGFLMMGLFFMGTMLQVVLVGYVFLLIWGIWWIADVFLTGKYVDENILKEGLKRDLKNQDIANDLKRLYELYEKGEISKAEFEARKEILFR